MESISHNILPQEEQMSPDEAWMKKGVDIGIIRENLKLSYEERVAQHQNTLDFIEKLKQMISANHARS